MDVGLRNIILELDSKNLILALKIDFDIDICSMLTVEDTHQNFGSSELFLPTVMQIKWHTLWLIIALSREHTVHELEDLN